MLLLLLSVILILVIVIIIFAFPRFSPIPYFPTNSKDLPLIINALKLRNNQTVIDLGAGNGVVIFSAAHEALKRNLNTQFIAIDINPVLLLIMHLRRLFHPNKQNIRIMYGNIFSMNFKKNLKLEIRNLTFYIYVSPWYIEKIIHNIQKQSDNFSIISYFYPIKNSNKPEKIIEGVHNIYCYE